MRRIRRFAQDQPGASGVACLRQIATRCTPCDGSGTLRSGLRMSCARVGDSVGFHQGSRVLPNQRLLLSARRSSGIGGFHAFNVTRIDTHPSSRMPSLAGCHWTLHESERGGRLSTVRRPGNAYSHPRFSARDQVPQIGGFNTFTSDGTAPWCSARFWQCLWWPAFPGC